MFSNYEFYLVRGRGDGVGPERTRERDDGTRRRRNESLLLKDFFAHHRERLGHAFSFQLGVRRKGIELLDVSHRRSRIVAGELFQSEGQQRADDHDHDNSVH